MSEDLKTQNEKLRDMVCRLTKQLREERDNPWREGTRQWDELKARTSRDLHRADDLLASLK